MASAISSFPCINLDMIDTICIYEGGYSFCYKSGNGIQPLIAEKISEDSAIYTASDSKGIWNCDNYNIGIIKHYEFKNISILFGENGIACRDSVIGAAIVWTSPDSKQRGVINVGEIRNNCEELSFHTEYFFEKAQLRGDIRFSTILYIKKCGNPSDNEQHLANECGCILGELDNYYLRLDGNGSMFPIYEISDKKKPLWTLSCEWEDPRYDSFSESIAININTAHKNYKNLDKSKVIHYDEQLMKEIISSALTIVIMKLKSEACWNDIATGYTQFEDGSVAQAVSYFITTLGWNVDKAENISRSIREFFDERM
ncbi:hypothetical protein ACN077_24655 [Clostridium chromiireducens]|uniref:hypothetical protein n=1 Tax=Clostridium chromiireducens TaxID=225345 RepID=UPI003AF83C14